MTLPIDPELKALIPPLSKDEYAALEASLLANKMARDPIVVAHFDGTSAICDGHNRYEICERLGLPYRTAAREFPSRDAVKQWMLANQLARRNLTRDQMIMLFALRGYTAPGYARTDSAYKARELAAANAPECSKVLAGSYTIGFAHSCYQRRQPGYVEPKRTKRVPAATPAATPPAPPPDEIAEAIGARKSKGDLTAERKRLNAALDRIAEQDRLIETLSAPASRPAFSAVKRLGSDKRQAWALALLSDVHAGSLVDPSASTCYNAYDPDIARESLDRYFESLAWLVKDEHAFDVHGLCVWIGGDIIDGHLHEDQVETSESPLVTLNWLEPFLEGRISALASELGDRELRLLCSYGNHGRDTMKPRAETGWRHSHEWAMYQRLARYFADHKTVRVITDKARDQYTDLFGFRIHGTHGDTTSNYQGGIGGITIPLRKSYATWQVLEPAYLHLTGHWHTQLDLGDGLANGSIVGYNAYARSKSFRPEAPQQIFCLIDSKRGKTKVSPVWVRSLTDKQREAMVKETRSWAERQ